MYTEVQCTSFIDHIGGSAHVCHCWTLPDWVAPDEGITEMPPLGPAEPAMFPTVVGTAPAVLAFLLLLLLVSGAGVVVVVLFVDGVVVLLVVTLVVVGVVVVVLLVVLVE